MAAHPSIADAARGFDFAALASQATLRAGTETRRDSAVIAPFSGETLACVTLGDADDVAEAVRRARAAQPAWAALSGRERAKILLRAHTLFIRERERLATLIQLESGKARAHALEEPLDVALKLGYYARHAPNWLKPQRRRGAIPLFVSARERAIPVGVIGIIGAWNFPLNLPMSDSVSALMAGNAVVLKPSELTPFSALLGVSLLREAGVPRDVMQVVVGDGQSVGAPLVDAVDGVMFTGSSAVGHKIAQQAAKRLIPASLELGGKNPAVIFDDADLTNTVANVAQGITSGAGQVCVSYERIYVQAGIYPRFAETLAAHMSALTLGFSTDYDIEIGSQISQVQVDKVAAHVADAVEKGARVLAGGQRRPDLGPFVFEPTLLEGVEPGMILYRDETFGPVAALYPFQDEAEAIRVANDSEFGLQAGVYSGDVKRGERVAAQIRCGSVTVNENFRMSWATTDAPMGGMKHSGLGRRHGKQGLLKFTQAQTIITGRIMPIKPNRLFPTRRFYALMLLMVQMWRRLPGIH
jgi:succinate-semialdehyde dehydrogenase/glutarate-semialdehyde dehydrogenase